MRLKIYLQSDRGTETVYPETEFLVKPSKGDVVLVNGNLWLCVEVVIDYDTSEVRARCTPHTPKGR